eukprot:gene32742-42398_t
MENFLGCDDEMETFMECLFSDYQFEGNLRAFVGSETESFYGFKAFNDKTGDLVIIIRGTIFLEDWKLDGQIFRKRWPASKGSPIFMHGGFLDVYQNKDSCNTNSKSLRESLEEYIAEVAEKVNAGKKFVKTISLAGHSLGAAVATIATLGVAEQIHNGSLGQFKPDVRLISFASPRVGGWNLWQQLKNLNVTYDHYFNAGDLVPNLPPPMYPFYLHHPDKKTQHKLKPTKKDLRSAKIIPYGFQRAHDMGHILYNIARVWVPSRINVSILNKHDDYLSDERHAKVPKKWFDLETRRLNTDGKNEVVEIDISSNNCNSYKYDNKQWSTDFINKYAFLHKKICESDSVRKAKHLDNYD